MSNFKGHRFEDKADADKSGDEAAKPAQQQPPKQLPWRPNIPSTTPAATQPAGALKRTNDLLTLGGFTRMLSWRERRAIRRIEKAALTMRSALHRAFPKGNAFVRQACDSLAHIEITSRLELMHEPAKTVEPIKHGDNRHEQRR